MEYSDEIRHFLMTILAIRRDMTPMLFDSQVASEPLVWSFYLELQEIENQILTQLSLKDMGGMVRYHDIVDDGQ